MAKILQTQAITAVSFKTDHQDRYGESAFGDQVIVTNRPFIQALPSYNFIPSNFREFTATGGSTGVESRKFKVSTGTSVGGYGAIQSFRSLNYKAGEGGLARFSGYFPSPVALTWTGIGMISIGDELSFGHNGTAFGIWHRYGGLAEARTITVTGAAGGSENLTLTLNSVAYTIPLTSGTVQHNAYEIEAWLNNSANQSVWVADQVDDTVVISSLSDGAKAGTYTYSSSTSTGSIAQDTAGLTKTSVHIPQTTWNQNTLSTLDPTKGNVYQIEYQDLLFGDALFYIEDNSTGKMELVHVLRYANTSTTPSLGNPSLKAGMYTASTGSTTDTSVYCGGWGLFMQGEEGRTRNPRAVINTQSIGTSFTSILTLRNRRTYNGYANQVEIQPAALSIAAEGSKNIEVELRSAANTQVEHNFQSVGNNLVSDVDTSSVTVSVGRLLAAYTVAGGSSVIIDLDKLRIRLPPSLKFVVQAKRASGSSADVTASLTYYEDV
jgi:hypothetical protein